MRLPKDLKASIKAEYRPDGPTVYHVTVTIKRKKYTYEAYGNTPLDAFGILAKAADDGYLDYEDVPVENPPEDEATTEAVMPEES